MQYFNEGHNQRNVSTREYSQCNISTRTTTIARFPRGPLPMQYFHEGHYQCNISTRATTNAIFPRGPLPMQYFHVGHYQCNISTRTTTNAVFLHGPQQNAIFPRGPLLSMADPLLMQDLNTLSRNSLNNTTSNTRHRQTPDLALDYILPPSIGIGKRCLECGPHSILALTYNTTPGESEN